MTEPATERPATATATSSSSSRPAPAPPPPLPLAAPSAPSASDNNISLPPTIAINDSTTHHQQPQQPQPFAPIYTLVNNTSTRTTHHPHVRYIFSDDDPDVLTQALAEHHEATAAEELSRSSDPTASNNSNRGVILDIATDDDGGYHVAWASSLSPSWAVLDAQLSQISPPSSSDGGAENDGGGGSGGASINPNININTVANTNTSNNNNNTNNKPGRLMLRIEGVECSSSLGSESESRLQQPSGEPGRLTASGGLGSGSASREREKGSETTEDYSAIVDEFEKRMVTLRKVVSANEERLQKTEGIDPSSDGEAAALAAAMGSQPGLEGGGAPTAD
ncbi:hypothetical protein SLS62_008692 [Diatrype stigma]|uniref:Uncharacterized protein n=1 Tax=Diatrype stigma TaxID=117547 RepID=A0AAN9YMY7_9PEZI